MMLDLGLGPASLAMTQRRGEPIELPDAPFAMTQLDAGRIYQRGTTTGGGEGKGQGSIAVALDVTATGPVFARCRAADGAILQPAWEAGGTSATGESLVEIEGVDARLGWFYLDLRGPGTQWALGTSLIGMGALTAVSGQSLAVRMFGRMDGQTTTLGDLEVVASANGRVFATYDDAQRTVSSAAWAEPADGSDYDSTFAAEFLRLQIAAVGVNCGLIGHARGGESISVFVPGGSENAQLRANLDAAGGFEQFIWMQGHSDAGSGMSGATYEGYLDDLFDDLAAHNPVLGAGFDAVLATIPNTSSTSWGTAAQKDAIRGAAKAWAAANGQCFIDPRDLDLVDGIHQSQLGSVRLAHHYHRAFASSDEGPVITGGTRALDSADVVLSVDLPAGATTLVASGNPQARFDVFVAGDTAMPLALDEATPITVGTDTITLHLDEVPTGADLDIWFCRSPDPSADGHSDMIYDDDETDSLPLGRQLAATLAPVTVLHDEDEEEAPPSYTGPDLTFVGTPSYATGKFGQAFSPGGSVYATVGSAPADGLPATNIWTLEGWLKIASAPGSVKVALSGGDEKCWIGIAPSGQLVMNSWTVDGDEYLLGTSYAGGGTMPTIADDAWHHVALVSGGASGFWGFFDGVLLAIDTSPSQNGAGNSVMNVGNHNNGGFIWPGLIDEAAVWNSARYPSTGNFTPPSAPYVGDEGMIRLWHLGGDGASGVIA